MAAIIYYLFILSLWPRFNITIYVRSFQLTSLWWKKVAKFSNNQNVAQTSHYINLGRFLERHLKPTYEAPRQRDWSILIVWVYERWTLVFLCPIYIPLALHCLSRASNGEWALNVLRGWDPWRFNLRKSTCLSVFFLHTTYISAFQFVVIFCPS